MNQVSHGIIRMLKRAQTSSDVILGVVVAMILGAMVVPLPPWLLDLGLALNMAAGLCMLATALFAKEALAVAAFPTALLVTTLFRLAMNISSTRLALADGHAGDIIQAFGEFVVRGDYVVGGVVFCILALVQFLVVAKGAERVAEVSARFTLDAMPGKQMSIDADLRAGAISQDQARSRRRALERESQLFGSMDGAMKFVKGDVIAGLLIVAINLIGGSIIGVFHHGQSFSDAAATYALIAIGDGLSSQIPSLCVAVAAGIVVTRVNSESPEDSLGSDLFRQFLGQHRVLWIISGLCIALGLIPGMPHLTFIVLAMISGLGAHRLQRSAETSGLGANFVEGGKTPAQRDSSNRADLTKTDGADMSRDSFRHVVAPITVDLAHDLGTLVETNEGSFVKLTLNQLREQLFEELGVHIPAIRVRTGAPLAPSTWRLQIDETPVAQWTLPSAAAYAFIASTELQSMGIAATPLTNPMSSAPLCSIEAGSRDAVTALGAETRSFAEIVSGCLKMALRRRASEFLGVQEVQSALSAFEPTAPALVKEVLQKVPLPLLTDVLKKLVHEQVSIRNLRAIFGALVAPTTEGDSSQLAERCRQALARQISHQFAQQGPLFAYLIDPSVEEKMRTSGPGGSIDSSDVTAIIDSVRSAASNRRAVLLASPDIRRLLRRLLEGVLPDLAVLSFSELDPSLQVRPVGRIVPAFGD